MMELAAATGAFFPDISQIDFSTPAIPEFLKSLLADDRGREMLERTVREVLERPDNEWLFMPKDNETEQVDLSDLIDLPMHGLLVLLPEMAFRSGFSRFANPTTRGPIQDREGNIWRVSVTAEGATVTCERNAFAVETARSRLSRMESQLAENLSRTKAVKANRRATEGGPDGPQKVERLADYDRTLRSLHGDAEKLQRQISEYRELTEADNEDVWHIPARLMDLRFLIGVKES